MKNLLLLTLLFYSSVSYAQWEGKNKKPKPKEEIVAKKTYLELGINLTSAIASGGFHFADNFLSADPYFLHLKFVTHRIGIRAGAGTSIYSQKTLNLLNEQGRISAVNRTDIRLGLDFQTAIDEHWRIYYGADFLTGFGKGQNDFLDKGVTSNIRYDDKTIGGGPLLGIQYHLNKRISFQTEATLYFTYNTETQTVTYSNLPTLNVEPTTKSQWKMPLGVPHSLFVIVRF